MKQIVIFGAASAIAQATARLWAKKDAAFVLIDRNENQLKIVADDLKVRGAGNVRTIATDLGEMSKHADLVSSITNHESPSIYLFAYGTLSNQQRGQSNFTYAHDELHLNFVSIASLLTEIINDKISTQLKAEQGTQDHASITLAVISSVAGDRGRQSNYIYGTAKGALTIWLQGLRNRLTREHPNIHVLTIKPGFVDTPMTKDFKKGLLWVKPGAVAKAITRAVEKERDVVYIPWFWRYIMLIIKLIPEAIFKKLGL